MLENHFLFYLFFAIYDLVLLKQNNVPLTHVLNAHMHASIVKVE